MVTDIWQPLPRIRSLEKTMTSVATFFLYAAVITAVVLILTYFTATTSARTKRSKQIGQALHSRQIRESVSNS